MEADERPSKMRKLSHGTEELMPCLEVVSETKDSTHVPDSRLQEGHAAIQSPQPQVNDGINGLGLVDEAENSSGQDAADSGDLPPPDETAPLAASDLIGAGDQPMSKNQRKKLQKKQEWEAKRGDRKIIRKEKLVAKRERKREARQQQNDETNGDRQVPAPAAIKVLPIKSVQLPVTFLIDCDFDGLMRDNERISLASQITRCYSDNKTAKFRAHLTVCSFTGKLRERFDNILTHYKGWRGAKQWMAEKKYGGSLAGSFSKYSGEDETTLPRLQQEGEIVYLSSEASDTLTELKPYSTYIIGGLVDKNREKGICYKRAKQRGIRTAKLPIGDYLQMSSRKVLATNHVNEIMVNWLETEDWGEAFMKVIPKRKGGQLKGQDDDQETEGGAEEIPDSEHDGDVEHVPSEDVLAKTA
ncbi:tRNA (guanine(9)-N(1))-methyltransferase [Recurvomyces mirabilis]|uniref:tRNA (guanine(9)-N1)-methyltransferase n=1 Tax=Recurvomyces mirabilis TaxID=574656 RepID=A0AAE0WSP7_9PEZI|nr:tRNA (guanine(9)-N(1))-methyltransferase [Recurvomyces mirabilis]